MSVLEWDKVGERFFETGIDRGVLYPVNGAINGPGVPWNGLTNISEDTSGEVKSFYLDGVKYLDHHVPGSYSAKLEAFTYPDVLDELTGIAPYAPGIYLHDQTAKVFHLSYRTGVGNDLDQEIGYKLHIVYNVMAIPSSSGITTIGESVDLTKMSWDLSGTPPQMLGARPTAHISLHSRKIDLEFLGIVEALLYGTNEIPAVEGVPAGEGTEAVEAQEAIPGTEPMLPTLVDLLTLIEGV